MSSDTPQRRRWPSSCPPRTSDARGPAGDVRAPVGAGARRRGARARDRPGIVDVVADAGRAVGARPLRACATPGSETRLIPDGDDAGARVLVDDDGRGRGRSTPCATPRWPRHAARARVGRGGRARARPPAPRRRRARSPWRWRTASPSPSTTRWSTGPRPDLELLLALDEVGLQPPRRPVGGLAPEPGATSAWSRSTCPAPRRATPLALTSVRDLYASGGPPELAGGDFGAEAHRLGTMTARMHLGLDKAFGRRARRRRRPGPAGSKRRCGRWRRTCWNGPTWRSCWPSCVRCRCRRRPSAPTGTSTWAGRAGPSRVGTSSTSPPGAGPTSMAGAVAPDPTTTGRCSAHRWRTWPTCCGPSGRWRPPPPTSATRRAATG